MASLYILAKLGTYTYPMMPTMSGLEPKLIFVSNQIRTSSLLYQLLQVEKSSLSIELISDKSNLIDFIKKNPSHLLASPFLESPTFKELVLGTAECMTAQVTFGSELQSLREEVKFFLDNGNSLQIWFDRPSDYPLIKNMFKDNWGQVTPVFWLTKKFPLDEIFSWNTDQELFFVAPPKQTSLDSFLEIEELHLWVARAKEKSQIRNLFIESFFRGKSISHKKYSRDLSEQSFQEVLLKRTPLFYLFFLIFQFFKKINLQPLLEIFKNIFLFISSPNRQTLGAVGHNLIGGLKSLGSFFYWKVFRLTNDLKMKIELARINGYWRAYRLKGTLRSLSIKLFWLMKSIYLRFKGRCFALGVAIYWLLYSAGTKIKWTIYSSLTKISGFLRSFSVTFYWTFIKRKTNIWDSLNLLYWTIYRWFTVLLALSWKLYSLAQIVSGLFAALWIELKWIPRRIYYFLREHTTRLYWIMYSIFRNAAGQVEAWSIRTYWKTVLCLKSISLPLRRLYWFFEFHYQIRKNQPSWLLLKLNYLLGQTYHKTKILILFVGYPVRKIYWFTSFQFKNRVLAKIGTLD